MKEKRINQLKADLTQRSENAEEGHYTRNEIANRNRNQTATDNRSARSKSKEWWNSTADSSSDVGLKQKQSKSAYSFWGEVAKNMERKQAFAQGKFASRAKYSQVDIDELPLDQQVSYYEGFHSTLGDYIAEAEVMMARAAAIKGVGGALKSAATYGMKKFGFFAIEDAKYLFNGSNNHVDSLRLRNQLLIDEVKSTYFTENGGLNESTIKNAKFVIGSDKVKNEKLINELLNRPGDLKDWAKYTTERIRTPSGEMQIRFYYNKTTNDVYYGMDYKSVFRHNGAWNSNPYPNFSFEPPQFKY